MSSRFKTLLWVTKHAGVSGKRAVVTKHAVATKRASTRVVRIERKAGFSRALRVEGQKPLRVEGQNRLRVEGQKPLRMGGQKTLRVEGQKTLRVEEQNGFSRYAMKRITLRTRKVSTRVDLQSDTGKDITVKTTERIRRAFCH